MKYILTVLVAAFTLSACSSTCDKSSACPHSKAKAGDSCCATKAGDKCCKKH